LNLVARDQVRLCVTQEIWAAYDTKIAAVLAEERPGVNSRPTLDWLLTVSFFVYPAPLGEQRSRDLKDDRYLACALGAGAGALVTNDRDLLDLGQPFGVPIIAAMELVN
jgi:predicted nucleic acid-binding protein